MPSLSLGGASFYGSTEPCSSGHGLQTAHSVQNYRVTMTVKLMARSLLSTGAFCRGALIKPCGSGVLTARQTVNRCEATRVES